MFDLKIAPRMADAMGALIGVRKSTARPPLPWQIALRKQGELSSRIAKIINDRTPPSRQQLRWREIAAAKRQRRDLKAHDWREARRVIRMVAAHG